MTLGERVSLLPKLSKEDQRELLRLRTSVQYQAMRVSFADTLDTLGLINRGGALEIRDLRKNLNGIKEEKADIQTELKAAKIKEDYAKPTLKLRFYSTLASLGHTDPFDKAFPKKRLEKEAEALKREVDTTQKALDAIPQLNADAISQQKRLQEQLTANAQALEISWASETRERALAYVVNNLSLREKVFRAYANRQPKDLQVEAYVGLNQALGIFNDVPQSGQELKGQRKLRPNGPNVTTLEKPTAIEQEDPYRVGIIKKVRRGADLISKLEILDEDQVNLLIQARAKANGGEDPRVYEDYKTILDSLRKNPINGGTIKLAGVTTTVNLKSVDLRRFDPSERLGVVLKHPKTHTHRVVYAVYKNGEKVLILDGDGFYTHEEFDKKYT